MANKAKENKKTGEELPVEYPLLRKLSRAVLAWVTLSAMTAFLEDKKPFGKN